MEMKIRESCLQTGTFIYKPGISATKQDFHLQMGSLGLQMGFSGYYLPYHTISFIYAYCTLVSDKIQHKPTKSNENDIWFVSF